MKNFPKQHILFTLFVFGCTVISTAQSTEKKAATDYDNYAYVDAKKTYERLYAKGLKSPDLILKLANSCYFNADFESAAKYYKAFFDLTPSTASAELYYRYAQSLKAITEYAKADEMMEKFKAQNSSDSRAKLAVNQKDYLAVIRSNSGRYDITNAGINSKYSDYGSAFHQDKVIFATGRDVSSKSDKMDPWTGEGYTNLYEANKNADGTLASAKIMEGNLNSRYHESTPVFTKNGKTVYFTRNNFVNGKIGNDNNATILLKIYKAELIDGQWKNIVELPFNSDQYSTAHPVLSTDEKILYFASNMPGTIGQSDIFKVAIGFDSSFGTPENLGNKINTEGRETFPFISAENELYFASDGHPGLGGLDVFVAKGKKEGVYDEVINVGAPLNSSKDDFGFIINTSNKLGFVTSNRDGGVGGDDIYRIKEIKPLQTACEQTLAGVVTDSNTKKAIEGVQIVLYDDNYKNLRSMMTDADGKFNFGVVDCSQKYYLQLSKKNYHVEEIPATTGDQSGETFLPIVLEESIQRVGLGDDLAKVFKINPIYFDFNKADIRMDAEIELSKILDFLLANPGVKIEIRSHTDSRLSDAYNFNLSKRRADSTKNWLIKYGVDATRLKAYGYGESQLLNKCADNVVCTEAEHQQNRRSEFIIVEIK